MFAFSHTLHIIAKPFLRAIKFSKNSLFQQFQFWGDRIRYNLSMKKVSEENERRRLMLRKNLENSRQIKFIGTNTSLYLKGHQIWDEVGCNG